LDYNIVKGDEYMDYTKLTDDEVARLAALGDSLAFLEMSFRSRRTVDRIIEKRREEQLRALRDISGKYQPCRSTSGS
jgi:hypothetical protein